MIGALGARLRRLRRAISRSHWWIRLARLSVSSTPPGSPGLIMLHLSGVTLDRFREAVRRGTVPFLSSLVERQDYAALRQHGLPAAAFQHALFYGELPGGSTEPLLRGGSSYADGPAGGAAEPHYYPGAGDWGPPFGMDRPLLTHLFALIHADAFVRAGLADVVAVAGAWWSRLTAMAGSQSSPSQTAAVVHDVLLREFIVAGIEIDIARGLPIVHASFNDYDHARQDGGDPVLPNRMLTGIDASIRRIWQAAHRSERRHYDLWIYSTMDSLQTGNDGAEMFALAPHDVPIMPEGRTEFRASDLRRAALGFLGRAAERMPVRRRRAPAGLRVMTYNVHSCLGTDGRLSPERIARVIARYSPDVVALQELDVSRARTGGVDQARAIASHLEMDFHFHPVVHLEEERYGDAILTHFPVRLIKAGPLPGTSGREPRGALWVAIDADDIEMQVINTHLGLLPEDRRRQTEALLGSEWMGNVECRDPVILCGDLNALPGSAVCRRIRGRLKDAQVAVAGRRPRGTFFGRFPMVRIDYIFVSDDVDVLGIEVPSTRMARVASDHLPLIADIRLSAAATEGMAELDRSGRTAYR